MRDLFWCYQMRCKSQASKPQQYPPTRVPFALVYAEFGRSWPGVVVVVPVFTKAQKTHKWHVVALSAGTLNVQTVRATLLAPMPGWGVGK